MGFGPSAIARDLGVPRSTVKNWLTRDGRADARRVRCDGRSCELVENVDEGAYVYVFGMYLGDGHITVMANGVQRLRISCCDDYPFVMDECERALQKVLPQNRITRVQCTGCTTLGVYSNHLKCLFPQHGAGKKSERPIVLWDWQKRIVATQAEGFVKGLLNSDGCRSINRVKVAGRYRGYPRYFFSNRSQDILRLFTDACDRLGVEWRQNLPWSISVARRDSVALLDKFVGPKS